ncbi:hypothetical protein [Chryseobacterium sp. YIM B08800]|uniref:hypothetical protein n=1 Tax=Chryseobacterium sp. YIM B08800 TaxID=2984136 RepID=UPI002240BABE|nr:hypothetical protein [Chryseobacterium sp. YIM B08800]
MNRDTHRELYQQYISNGGDAKKVQLYKSFSPANYAKLKYFVKQLNIDVPFPDAGSAKKITQTVTKVNTPEKPRKSIFSDFISQYPKELHSAFKQRYDHWLEACALKVELNDVHQTDEETAYDIQFKLLDHLEKMDRCQKALDHYNKNKRIMLTETLADFSKLSPMELLKKRNATRSNITKRKATIKKMEDALPKNTDPDYRRKLHQVNCKIEQLIVIENELEKLEETIKNQ